MSDRSAAERFAATLRQLMDAAGVSGAELGRQLDGTDKSVVSRWRNGLDRPEPATVIKIADFFGVDRIDMLKHAGWYPGEAAEIKPQLVSLNAVLNRASDEQLADIEHYARYRVQPIQNPRPNRRRDASANRREDKVREIEEKKRRTGESGPNSALTGCSDPFSSTLARIVDRRLVVPDWEPDSIPA